MPVAIYVGSDNRIELTGLRDPDDDSYVNDATVTALLKDSADANTISGSSITLTYVTGSDGNYRGSMPNTVSLTDGTSYYVHVSASSSGRDVLVRKLCKAEYYQGCDC
jgi:hypothetical protein